MQPGDAIRLQINDAADIRHVRCWDVGLVLATSDLECLVLWSGHDPITRLGWFAKDVLDDCAEVLGRTCKS